MLFDKRRHVEIITYALEKAARNKARRAAYPRCYSGVVIRESRTHIWLRTLHGQVIALPYARISSVTDVSDVVA